MNNRIAEQLKEKIDNAVSPDAVPAKGDALDILEDVMEHIRSSCEALREEMANDE